jgi:hypothetical protein
MGGALVISWKQKRDSIRRNFTRAQVVLAIYSDIRVHVFVVAGCVAVATTVHQEAELGREAGAKVLRHEAVDEGIQTAEMELTVV